MTVLFGHPTGNPNSHHAALAHFEAGWLEAFCVPWMPSEASLALLTGIVGRSQAIARLSRRNFKPLSGARLIQGRPGELQRLLLRSIGKGNEGLAYQANDWLMRTMAREVKRAPVTVVHAYEDCSLWQFQSAKAKGAACIYDLPIGYYPVWQRMEGELKRKYNDWLPDGHTDRRYVRPEQKAKELDLADVVLAPSSFVQTTVREYFPNKPISIAPYGVNSDFWEPASERKPNRALTFICAGQICVRKGSPDLLRAWAIADLKDAELHLVGSWNLADERLKALPRNVKWYPPCSAEALRERYRGADVFVFPSYFEGLSLVLLEALACGLPAIASSASGMADLFSGAEGFLLDPGDLDALVSALRWAEANRDQLGKMGAAARKRAELCSWASYRTRVQDAVRHYL